MREVHRPPAQVRDRMSQVRARPTPSVFTRKPDRHASSSESVQRKCRGLKSRYTLKWTVLNWCEALERSMPQNLASGAGPLSVSKTAEFRSSGRCNRNRSCTGGWEGEVRHHRTQLSEAQRSLLGDRKSNNSDADERRLFLHRCRLNPLHYWRRGPRSRLVRIRKFRNFFPKKLSGRFRAPREGGKGARSPADISVDGTRQ